MDTKPIEYADYEVVVRYVKRPDIVGERQYRPVKSCDPIDAIIIAVLLFRPEVNGLNFQSIEIIHRPLPK